MFTSLTKHYLLGSPATLSLCDDDPLGRVIYGTYALRLLEQCVSSSIVTNCLVLWESTANGAVCGPDFTFVLPHTGL